MAMEGPMLRSLATLAVLAGLAGPATADGGPSWVAALHNEGPGIRVWTSSGDLFHRGDRVRVYFRTERDAYVTVFRVDTDGRVRVLFPRIPDDDNWAAGGTTYQLSAYDRGVGFMVDDYPGVGYVFGVASNEPFDYHEMVAADGWDVREVSGGRVHGDPLSSLEEMVQGLLPAGYADFDDHLVPYYVDQRYDYPRFVCYDCHAYTPFAYWDPYLSWCPRYTLVVWNDPWYYYPSYWYPTRYYGGTRVVYVAPTYRSRYVFKNRESSAPGIAYRDRRFDGAAGADRRRTDFVGVRGTDVGGVGAVPAPRSRGGVDPTGRRTVAGAGEVGAHGVQPESPVDGNRRRAAPGGTSGAQPVITGGNDSPRRRGEIDTPSSPTRSQSQPRTGEFTRRGASDVPQITPSGGSAKEPDRGSAADRRRPDQGAQPTQPSQGYGGREVERAPRSEPRAAPAPRNESPRSEPRAAPPRSEPPRSAPAPRSEPPRSAPAPRSEPPRSAPQPSQRGGGSRPQGGGLVRRRP